MNSTRIDFPIPGGFSGVSAFDFPPLAFRRRGILEVRILRCVTLIVSLAVVAIALVYLRWEQTRIAAGLVHAETRWVALRREWWSVQASTARFRSPARMRGRAGVIYDHPYDLVGRQSDYVGRQSGFTGLAIGRIGDRPHYE